MLAPWRGEWRQRERPHVDGTVEQKGAAGSIGWAIWACCAYIIISIGRIGEIVPQLGNMPLAKIAIGLAIVGALLRYKHLSTQAIWDSRIGRTGTLLFALSVASVLFSVWRYNSLMVVRDQVLVLAIAYVLFFKTAAQWRQIEALMRALVLAGGVLAFAALHGYTGGRAEVATMYDTNDLAFILVAVLPIAVAFAFTRSGATRLMYLAIAAALLVTVLLTASRGGFLGLVTVVAMLIFARLWPRTPREVRGRGARTIGSLVLFASICAITWTQIPAETQQRIATIFHIESDYNLDTSDSNGRLAIWKRNFFAGVKRPIGFGIGSFGVVDLMTGGNERAPHNTLLEVFVELGVVGLLLLLRIYWIGLSQLTSVGRLPIAGYASARQHDRAVFARCLRVSLVGTLVSGFFLSMLNSILLWTLFAIAAALIATSSGSDLEASNQPMDA